LCFFVPSFLSSTSILYIPVFMYITTHEWIFIKFDVWGVLLRFMNPYHLRLKLDKTSSSLHDILLSHPAQLSNYICMYQCSSLLMNIGAGIAQWVYRRATFWAVRVRFPARMRNFSLLHDGQTGSGAHRASYPMGTGGAFSAEIGTGCLPNTN
jgi:hypothetical protein